MMKNILLIGLGRFGRHIAMELNELGHEIMAVDVNEGRVDKVLPYVTNAQIGDSTNAEFLESLGIGNYDICYDWRKLSKCIRDHIFIKGTWCKNGYFESREGCSGEVPFKKWCR